jgi:hypothetical protein
MKIEFQDLIVGETFINDEKVYKKCDGNTAEEMYSNRIVQFALCEEICLTQRTNQDWLDHYLMARQAGILLYKEKE